MRHSASPPRPGVLGAVGRTCYRHRWLTLAAWLVGTACLITLWMQFGASANNNFAGSDNGQTILNQHFPRNSGDTLTLAIRSAEPITSAGVKARVTGALGPFRNAPHVTSVSDPYTTPGHVSRGGHIAFASVQFNVTQTSIPSSEANALMNDARAVSGHGVTFSLGGDVVDQAETPYGGSSDGIGIGAAAIVFPEKLPVTTWVPMFLFVILFGLSMDYEVFLLSRIREEYDRTGDNTAAVARGLARTARVISAAATIMVVVFLSFVLGADVSVKQVGLGLAVAVLIDATIVRLVLVPAVMELLGRANWWLPGPLARILPSGLAADNVPAAPVSVAAGDSVPR